MARQEFTRPDTENPMYQRLWANLDKKQRKWLVRYNRIPVYGEDGILYVIPYSRFHSGCMAYNHRHDFYHVSVQEFVKIKGKYKFKWLRCGGINKADAAANVLGIKLLLESDCPLDYLRRAQAINSDYYGKILAGMTLRETLKIPVDGIKVLGESVKEEG